MAYQLWPCSAKAPKVAVSMQLMEQMRGFMLNSHVSTKGFVDTVTFLNNLSVEEVL